MQKAMSLTELWKEHSEAKFPPGYGGRDVDGICVTSLDSYAAGCISSYLRVAEESIELKRFQGLKNCKDDLERLLPRLSGYAFEYFNRVHKMCSLIVTEASIA